MPLAIKVVFRTGGKAYYFSPAGLDINYGSEVIVKTDKGLETAKVVSCVKEIEDSELVSPLKEILREANDEDREKARKHREAEEEYLYSCKEKVKNLNLEMKVINAEVSFDSKKVTFHFTAEQRIDFRQLVKDLSSELKLKVEMRQVGARDEAKLVGGIGCCGNRLCCTQFICDSEPVSIKMAKEQNLPLNPSKISGNCGRLMCCLKYENEVYKEFKKNAPKIGRTINTKEGAGKVIDYNVIKNTVTVTLESGSRLEYPLEED